MGEANKMEDTIYRQTAIDAIKHHAEIENDYTDIYHDGYCDGIFDAVDTLVDLPPAQPEPQWTPVSKGLPEENIPVLLGVRFEDDFKYFVTARMDYNYWTGLGRDIRGKLAWMPLPEPYKGE